MRLARWQRVATIPILLVFFGVFTDVHGQYGIGMQGENSEIRRNVRSASSDLVTLTIRDSSVLFAIREIARATSTRISFDPKLPQLKKKIHLFVDRKSARDAVSLALRETGLVAIFAADGETIVVRAMDTVERHALATGTIYGTIVDSLTGQPLAGVLVSHGGSKQSTTTTAKGLFALLNVPVGSRLITAKLLGYRTVSASIDVRENEQHQFNIAMMQASTMLSGVVTTVSGAQNRRSVGNDITVVNVDSVMRVAPITSVTDLLETRVPGLTVIRSSGVPGAPARIRLRGIGSGLVAGAANTSNDPIVIVDGIRVYAQQSTARDRSLAPISGQDNSYPPTSALDQIDPNSIETIEVFKGPSATSQWGADAGNGVIVITTKKGRAGPTRINSAFTVSTEKMPGTYAPPGFYRFAHGLGNTTSQLCSPFDLSGFCAYTDSVVRFQALNDSRLSPFGTGLGQSGSTTVTGGTDLITYSFTGSAQKTIGYLQMPKFYQELYREHYKMQAPRWMKEPATYAGWGLNTSVTAKPTPTLFVTFVTSLSTSDAGRASGQNTLSLLSDQYIDTAGLRLNPFLVNLGSSIGLGIFAERSQSRSVTSNIGGNVDWTRWTFLRLGATLGLNTINREDRVTVPFGTSKSNFVDTLGQFGIGRGHSVIRSSNLNATIFPDRIVTSAFGLQVTQSTTNDFMLQADTLQAGVGMPTTFTRAQQQSFASTTAGWFFEPRLNLRSRFFVAPGLRFDGGSAASQRRTGGRGLMALFPKLNFSWLAVDDAEDAALWGVLSMLRPRLSFGVAGVQPQPEWNLRLMTNGADGVGAVPFDGVMLRSLGNPGLHPERSRELEGGFDASLWGGRVNLNLTGYSKLRIDAIQAMDVAPSVVGVGLAIPYFVNIGRIRNTGMEAEINMRLIEHQLFAWGVTASLSTNRNIVEVLGGDFPYIESSDGSRLQPGYPIGGRWGRPIAGYRTDPISGRLGSIDDVTLADSAVYLGSGFPKWQLPMNTTFSLWRGVASVAASFEYKSGVTQFNVGGLGLLKRMYSNPEASLAQQAVALAADGYTWDKGRGSINALVQTTNSLRWQTLSLNYNVPHTMSRLLRLPRTTVAVQGSNLGLWTTYRGKDPDVNGGFNEDLIDTGEPPRPRTWTLRFTMSN